MGLCMSYCEITVFYVNLLDIMCYIVFGALHNFNVDVKSLEMLIKLELELKDIMNENSGGMLLNVTPNKKYQLVNN